MCGVTHCVLEDEGVADDPHTLAVAAVEERGIVDGGPHAALVVGGVHADDDHVGAPLGTARVGNEVEVLLQALQTLEEPFDVNALSAFNSSFSLFSF